MSERNEEIEEMGEAYEQGFWFENVCRAVPINNVQVRCTGCDETVIYNADAELPFDWIRAHYPHRDQQPEPLLILGADEICPITKKHCDDECCPVGAQCNLSGSDMQVEV